MHQEMNEIREWNHGMKIEFGNELESLRNR